MRRPTNLVAALLGLVLAMGGCGSTNTREPDAALGDVARDAPPDVLADAVDLWRVAVDLVDTAVVVPLPETHRVPMSAPADPTFHVGPYVMHTTGTRVTVVWESEVAGSTRVEYGLDDGYGNQMDGDAGTMHEVVVADLTPATLYHYRVCTGDICTGDLTFSTAPVAGQKFRFAVYGDSRSDPVTHGAVAANIIVDQPVVVFNVGDVVGEGLREEYKEQHFDPTRRLGHQVPIYVAIGNHEWKEADALGTEDVPNFREYMAFPKFPELRIQELSYSFAFGDAFFLVLDNTMDGGDIFFELAGVEMPLAKWLREQAQSEAAKQARWRFAFMHYPPGSPCEEDNMMVIATRDEVVPLLRENGFHALFAGHVHDYERYDYDGFPVIVAGGGGASLEDVTACQGQTPPELLEIVSAYHHLTVDLQDEQALIQAVGLDGATFDEVTIPNSQ